MSDKIDFQSKTVVRDKGHHVMIKESIYQEDITIVNIYGVTIREPEFIKQILTEVEREIDK